MEYSPKSAPLIYGAMASIMKATGAISKDRKNQQGSGYMFRGIDDVYNSVHSILADNGVFCTPEVLETKREERTSNSGANLIYTMVKVKYTFWAQDGSSVTAITIGEGFDSGDKSSNKAMSGAQKYLFLQTFCIPTKEEKDSENETPEVAPRQEAFVSKGAHGGAKSNGMTVEEAGAFIMPFGKTKGTQLKDMLLDDIQGAARWAEEKGKFKEFVVAANIWLGAANQDATAWTDEQLPF